jgi:hypothetical protein
MKFLLHVGIFSHKLEVPHLSWKFLPIVSLSRDSHTLKLGSSLLIIWEVPPFGSFHFMV